MVDNPHRDRRAHLPGAVDVWTDPNRGVSICPPVAVRPGRVGIQHPAGLDPPTRRTETASGRGPGQTGSVWPGLSDGGRDRRRSGDLPLFRWSDALRW